eukprot:XP_015582822.1 WAT1-related protein At1g43650 isoform X1 [Ricinus communis]
MGIQDYVLEIYASLSFDFCPKQFFTSLLRHGSCLQAWVKSSCLCNLSIRFRLFAGPSFCMFSRKKGEAEDDTSIVLGDLCAFSSRVLHITHSHIIQKERDNNSQNFLFVNTRASLTLNMYFASLKYTNPTFVTSMTNAIPSMTFLFAVILRLEVINVRTPRGVAKIVGTLMSLAGALVLAFYKGPKMKSLQGAPIHIRSSHVQQNWMKGSFLLLASCITWSLWFILQVYTLRKYPAQLSLTAWINFLGGAQSAVFTLFIQHKPEAWAIKIDINFWCILYAGVVICAVTVFVQLWCTKQKGPVFVTMFSPLSTILVTILAYFLFGEELRTGSLVGGGIVIIGLYLLLLGKEGDQDRTKSNEQSFPIHDQEKDLKIQMETSAQREAAHQDPEK